MKCNISIHDVSPDNLNLINEIIIDLSEKHGIKKITLLIIPGLSWSQNHIDRLRHWQQKDKIELAAHGWEHKSDTPRSLFHYLHSKFISDDCAEHLSKSNSEIIKIMKNSFEWFQNNGLNAPTLYVPPAWALGNINKGDLQSLPFNEIEVMSGVFVENRFVFIPLIGFETKTYFRFITVKILNKINYILQKNIGVIRIALHPNDFNLLLKKDIDKYLSKVTSTFCYNEI